MSEPADTLSVSAKPTMVITAEEASGSHRSTSGPCVPKRLMKRWAHTNREPKSEQRRGKSGAKSHDQKQAERDPMKRQLAKQNYVGRQRSGVAAS